MGQATYETSNVRKIARMDSRIEHVSICIQTKTNQSNILIAIGIALLSSTPMTYLSTGVTIRTSRNWWLTTVNRKTMSATIWYTMLGRMLMKLIDHEVGINCYSADPSLSTWKTLNQPQLQGRY